MSPHTLFSVLLLASSVSALTLSVIAPVPTSVCPANTVFTSVTSVTHVDVAASTAYTSCCAIQGAECSSYAGPNGFGSLCTELGDKYYCAGTHSATPSFIDDSGFTTSPPQPTTPRIPSSVPNSITSHSQTTTTSKSSTATGCAASVISGAACTVTNFNTGCLAPTAVPTTCSTISAVACGATAVRTGTCTILPTTTCGSTGYLGAATFSVAAFANTLAGNSLTILSTAVPTASGVATNANLMTDDTVFPAANAKVFRGYFVPPCSGLYWFNIPISTTAMATTDDIFYLWFGANAYSGWTNTNAVLYSALTPVAPSVATLNYYVYLTGGKHYPIRYVYINTVIGGARYGFNVNYLSAGTQASATIVPFADSYITCDASRGAPPFPNFGDEGKSPMLVPNDYVQPTIFATTIPVLL